MNEEKTSFTAEEYTPEIKRQKMFGQEINLNISEEEVLALNSLSERVNIWAITKGWNDGEQSKPTQIALMHSELSECLEFIRKKEQPAMDDHVPDLTGEAAELADILIRIFHYCGLYKINLGEAVRKKHAYNLQRPYKHGGKKF